MPQVAELRLQVLDELGCLLSGEWNCARRHVATLNHEARHNAMPDCVVEQSRLAQLEEIPHSLWRLLWKKLDFDISQVVTNRTR
jgi:hypothetical protein